MRYRGRQYTGVDVLSFGGGQYGIWIPYPDGDGAFGILIATFWADVDTKALKEGKNRRFFERIIPESEMDIIERQRGSINFKNCVSWNSLPKVWQDAFREPFETQLKLYGLWKEPKE